MIKFYKFRGYTTKRLEGQSADRSLAMKPPHRCSRLSFGMTNNAGRFDSLQRTPFRQSQNNNMLAVTTWRSTNRILHEPIQSLGRAVNLEGPSVYQGGPKFDIKHKSRCLQKYELVHWGGQAHRLGGGGTRPLLGAGFEPTR